MRAGHLNIDDYKKRLKMTHFQQKTSALKLLMVTFWAHISSIFHAGQFFINSEHTLHILSHKNGTKFSPNFIPFFTARPTTKCSNNHLKEIPDGSMVEYLPVGPKGAPKPFLEKPPALCAL